MNSQSAPLHVRPSDGPGWAWTLIRVPLLAVLVVLTPAVDFVCGGLLLLGIAVSITFRISAVGAMFPFWHMIGVSFAFALVILIHHALIGLLTR
jgi:hypothetical protein